MAKDALFRRRIETNWCGMRDFDVLDCCCNLIGIGEPSR